VVSSAMRDHLDSLTGVQVRYFPFPSDPRFFLAFPDMLIRVEKESNAIRSEGYCPLCRRVTWSGFGSEHSPLPKDFILGALPFENSAGAHPLWIACEDVVNSLKKATLKGIEIHPY